MNLRVLKPSRKRLREGDLFTMQLPNYRYLFGRVVDTKATSGTEVPGAILIYIHEPMFDSSEPPERGRLVRDRLLVPPIMTNRLPWSRGYFETVAHWPLEPKDVLAPHCFVTEIYAAGPRYFDEKGRELPGPIEPVGDRGLNSFRTIDDQVSDATGIARVPDWDE